MCTHSNSIIISTIVLPDNDNKINDNPNQSFTGYGCRPSRKWVMDHLKMHYKYVYISNKQPNHPEFPINWNKIKSNFNTRVFFSSNNKDLINIDQWSEIILNVQTY